MQGIQQSYTQYYNRKYVRVGHVFEQRYKATLCKQDAYLINLLRYVHQNPLKAGVTQNVEYEWTSHRAYHTGDDLLVDIEFILAYSADNIQTAINRYRLFMAEKELADDSWNIDEVYLHSELPSEKNHQRISNLSYERILEAIENAMGVGRDRIMRDKYYRQAAKARAMLIYLVSEFAIMSKLELSKMLPISVTGLLIVITGLLKMT